MNVPTSHKTSTTTSNDTEATSTISCYNCRGRGHISRDCPRPQRPMKCSGCGSDQHRRSGCPAPTVGKSNNGESGQAYQVNAAHVVIRSNPFEKSVSLNNVQLSGLIDTGCSAVLVRQSAATKCGLTVLPRTIPLFTVGSVNQPSTCAVGEAQANVTIDGVSAESHDLKIVDDNSIPVDVLVGRTWLELPHVGYYKQGNELVIETNCHLEGTVLTDETCCGDAQVLAVECENEQFPVVPIFGDEVNIDPGVDADGRKILLSLLNRYRHVFAKSIRELGCTNLLTMDIVEADNSVPVRMKPYKTSPTDRRKIAEILQEWKQAGIVSDSASPYASPVLLVDKANGEKRLCVDY
ncbi:unnamed protein product [Macrosiphum euphorbiae]|uniref:CCHC-type domain-containing protein n=1 Tax=Macrosiphum euphorbiae TaxID=13131 RepID=A0AAV0YA38_9HEMI|nr:unnamed protein product [Macrosiphum euphorbiae]